MRKQNLIILAFLCSVFWGYAQEEKSILVQSPWEITNLNEYTYHFSTRDKNLSIEDVLHEKFTYFPKGLNVGLTDKIHWVRFSFINPADTSVELYIFFPYSDINKIEPYVLRGAEIQKLKPIGTYYSQKNKDFPSRGYPIRVSFPPGKTTVIIKVDHMYLPLRGVSYLLTEEQVLDSTLSMQRVLYAWQGILLFVLILTFTLYYFLKIPSFLYYSLLNLGILLFFFAEVGDYFMFFDRDIYDHIIDIKHLGNVLVLFLLPLFIDALTDIRKTHPVLWKALFYGIAIGPVLWAICLIPPLKDTYFMYYSTLYFIVGSAAEFILMLFFTLEAVRKKHRNALAVFIIYSVYFSAAFVNVILPNMGNMQSELQVYNTFIYGSLFEFVAFLSLLANETFVVYRDRTRLLEKQKAHQHEIIKAIVESQERERNRVGRELHDMIGANISVIKQQVDKRNKSLISIIERTIESVRTLSHGLVTPQIKDDEFVDEIVELCVAFSNMDLQVKSHFHNWYKSIDPKIATHLYRIVQELLQNAVKHSGASEVFVQFIVDNDNVLTLMYEDNGKGFDYYSIHQQDGLGLINIENRIKLIGARIFYDTKPNGRGTTIIIELDLKA